MPKALPEHIYPLRLARHGETLAGSVGLGQMPRLAALLYEKGGAADIALSFGRSDDGQACVCGRIDAGLALLCQRCLEPMRIDVGREVSLALVAEDTEAAALDARYEPLLVGDEPVPLAGLIEDELILALPDFSRHPDGQCEMPPGADGVEDSARGKHDGEAETSGDSGEENPFSILQSLKPRKSP